MKTRIINLPRIEDPRGNLSFIQENNHIPFEIRKHIGYTMCLVTKTEVVKH
jgi:hypothetical protein